MILIFAAKAIGESRFFIPRAGDLFAAMLDQSQHLNEWVISFVTGTVPTCSPMTQCLLQMQTQLPLE